MFFLEQIQFIGLIFATLLLALGLSIIVELGVASLFIRDQKRWSLIIVLINVLTNLPLNWFITLFYWKDIFTLQFPLIWLMEGIVVLVEWKLLVYSIKGSSQKMFWLSLIMNIVSYLTGRLVFP